jgi:hypothetical protein
MPQLKPQDVGEILKRMNALYQPEGRCSKVADKPHLQDLANRLRSYTDQVQAEADRQGLGDDANVAQWATDMQSWRVRLASYQQALDEATQPRGMPSCEELYPTVVGPLLDGVFSGAKSTEGILNPAVATVPDISTPYMLGNQVLVYRDFQADNFKALVDYFVDEAKRVGKKIAKTAKRSAPSVLMVGLGVALGAAGIGYLVSEAKKVRPSK